MHVQRHTVYMHVQPYRMLNTTRSLALLALRHSHPRTSRHLSSTTRWGTTTRTCTAFRMHAQLVAEQRHQQANTVHRLALRETSGEGGGARKDAGIRERRTTTVRATSGLEGVCAERTSQTRRRTSTGSAAVEWSRTTRTAVTARWMTTMTSETTTTDYTTESPASHSTTAAAVPYRSLRVQSLSYEGA